ncbi:Phage tail assembly chaperone protein, E, or 41 or 14 [Variovorax sp. YR752]|uniref:phage tail assembly protein n=1 Tax=Variovorax sp. YR752 TaxID=1884383 RepID=UPI000BD8BE4D|nr:phage tail assembly protein [Variovorax sp. YR752]SOD27657.1 Phage tail assembly chaperone protein, E, or 41 or 14 [Variovorax sp. YR752]
MNLNDTNGTGDGQEPTTTPTVVPGEVILDTPVVRGSQTIAKVVIRKPRSGELRGTSLSALMQMDVIALTMVLPRVTVPTLTKPEIEALEPADLAQLGAEMVNFLLPRADRIPASQST